MFLAKNIQLIRKWLGVSQQQFGEKFGVSRAAIAKWETGANEPPLAAVISLEDISGIPVLQLFRREIEMEELVGMDASILREPEYKHPYSKSGTSSLDLEELLTILNAIQTKLEADQSLAAFDRKTNSEMRNKLTALEKRFEQLDTEIKKLKKK